ncbi:GNAT family N-acetyltransferase [Tuwongella immobilis]|uniref:N-acetyltransferase domain-containing protein n=1 Tax=Tuwongella immobilis TaxID=692036 RepID=A0A6C2YIU5_9BACT|nr:GNAT family N-acetyltransferase [Tuwongella immobilis]VIP01005.1 acetyltransferase : Acetyltransferase OS=Synechococcus sp. PCC 7502 GN=Syn7502_00338 PE=4 SV=1: Acetyltransf_1 [Tuwongella immobilis]VTR97434.1 acetyltransferase : Acetyltransferase OS=Synechococcus sp. PCC 7502 GN=Syn7502_00338 PE=4 SV=1: Acetyltransf_1 [Tuwongella immobilis]
MIRATLPDDHDAVIDIAIAAGLVPAEYSAGLSDVFHQSLSGTSDSEQLWLTFVAESHPVGVAYVAPERWADGVWNMLMIAVRPHTQRHGIGQQLVAAIEARLQDRGARILIADTSGLPEFVGARSFYHRCGFHEEARIRDYWKVGDDKITFRKVLLAPTAAPESRGSE